MAGALKYDYMPLDAYLVGERDVELRSEYVDGKVYAMAGASRTHNSISMSFASALDNEIKDDCRVWQSDMKTVIHNSDEQSFAYYPDIMVACDLDEENEYVCTKPILIVEVLSDSTERVDLKEKFDNYTRIPTLVEYAVVSQDVPLVRLFRRRATWQQESYYAEDSFHLESVGLEVTVQQVYRRVRKEVGLEVSR